MSNHQSLSDEKKLLLSIASAIQTRREEVAESTDQCEMSEERASELFNKMVDEAPARAKRLRVRPLFCPNDIEEAKSDFAIAARNGGEITEEVRELMKADRERAEREKKSK